MKKFIWTFRTLEKWRSFFLIYIYVSEKHGAEGVEEKAVRSIGSAQRLHIGRILEP